MYIYILIVFATFLCIGSIYFYVFQRYIFSIEQEIIESFSYRNDSIPSVYEISRGHLSRYDEIFQEILQLRKQEFHLKEVSQNIEVYYTLEAKIHHEMNFVFQVCNKSPHISRNKKFLYIRDVIMEKSEKISQLIQHHKKYLQVYNTAVKYKNYTLIGYLIPFYKKEELDV